MVRREVNEEGEMKEGGGEEMRESEFAEDWTGSRIETGQRMEGEEYAVVHSRLM